MLLLVLLYCCLFFFKHETADEMRISDWSSDVCSSDLMSFADLGLSDELLRAVEDSGYTEPTPVQRQAIPSVLMNKDLIAIAQTGTGKTASFVLPMIDILSHGRARARMTSALILEPTRKLEIGQESCRGRW